MGLYMTLAKILSISVCMGVGSLAFATDPTPPAATTATAPATPDAPSTTAADQAKTATTTATTATTAKASDSITPEQAKMFRSAGYKAEVRNGITYYCRGETQVGTRFETKVCSTADDIRRSTVSSQELVNSIQRGSGH
jgi:hypothetical protein